METKFNNIMYDFPNLKQINGYERIIDFVGEENAKKMDKEIEHWLSLDKNTFDTLMEWGLIPVIYEVFIGLFEVDDFLTYLEQSERLFHWCCNGQINLLASDIDMWSHKKCVCYRFGKSHSLIMGALRNREYQTVGLLLDHNQRILDHEQEEFKELMLNAVGIQERRN